jgi:hypothetical protein
MGISAHAHGSMSHCCVGAAAALLLLWHCEVGVTLAGVNVPSPTRTPDTILP